MLNIFQVGDVVVGRNFGNNFLPVEWHGERLSHPQANGRLLYRSGYASFGSSRGSAGLTRKITEARLRDVDTLSSSGVIQKLRRLGGRSVPIFGYVMLSEICGRNVEKYRNILLWLETVGSVSVNVRRDNQQLPYVSISIEHDPYWYPLNRLKWAYETADNHPSDLIETAPIIASPSSVLPNYLSAYPGMNALFGGNSLWLQKHYDNPNFIYEPDILAAIDILGTSRYEIMVEPQYLIDYPDIGYINTKTNTLSYSPTMQPEIWSAPPISVYLFDHVAGDISITVEKSDDGMIYTSESVNITLAELIAATGGLLASDVILIGDEPIHGVALYRDGGIFPLSSLGTSEVCTLGIYSNDVTITCTGSGTVITVYHLWRRS